MLPRHELALKFSRMLVALLVVSTLVRPWLVSLDPVFTGFGVLNILVSLGTYALIRAGRHPAWEAWLLLGAALICLVPLLLVSGGVSSQFACLVPLYPLLATMLGGNRHALVACGLWLALLAAMTVAGPALLDLTGDPYSHGKSVSRGVWLCLGVAASTGLGVFFQRSYARLARELHRQATRDHLTGLLNRRAIDAALDQELRRRARSGGSLAVLMIDVDHFKTFNDRCGHAAGDECLVAIARSLTRVTRQGQDVVGRYGGEEFLVLLTGTGIAEAERVADKLREAVRGVRVHGSAEAVTVTVGMAAVAAPMEIDRESLLRRADAALYRGKLAGRDRVVVNADDEAPAGLRPAFP